MRRLRGLGPLTLAFAALIVLAAPGRAQEDTEPGWSQQDAAKLAARLAEAVERLWEQARLEEYALESTPSSTENYLLIEDLKMLERHSRALAERLERGEGREQTAPLFLRIEGLVAEARTLKSHSPILQGAGAEIDQARQVLDALRRYYEGRTAPVAEPPPEKNDEPDEAKKK